MIKGQYSCRQADMMYNPRLWVSHISPVSNLHVMHDSSSLSIHYVPAIFLHFQHKPTAQRFANLISMATQINLIKKLMDPSPTYNISSCRPPLVEKRNNYKRCTNSEGTCTNILFIAVDIIGNFIRDKAMVVCARHAAKFYKLSGIFG
jgi:hypothetical protein